MTVGDEAAIPLKQGLKQYDQTGFVPGYLKDEAAIPLKQGLKLNTHT